MSKNLLLPCGKQLPRRSSYRKMTRSHASTRSSKEAMSNWKRLLLPQVMTCKNLFRTVRVYAQLLNERAGASFDEETQKLVDIIESGAVRMGALISHYSIMVGLAAHQLKRGSSTLRLFG